MTKELVDATGTVFESYIHNGNEILAVFDENHDVSEVMLDGPTIDFHQAIENISDGEVYWLGSDHQNTVQDILILDGSGEIAFSKKT